MSKRTRRDFLRTGALAAAGTASGYTPSQSSTKKRVAKPTLPPSVLGANKRLTIGFVGIGGWARYTHLKHIVEYGPEWNAVGAAVCDPWSKNRDRGLEMLGLGAEKLTGEVNGEPVTIVILDHPSNVNYPTHRMARGYGLFAANPLGSRDYTDGAEQLDYSLAPGESVTFRYRMLIHSGPRPTSKWFDDHEARFAVDDE